MKLSISFKRYQLVVVSQKIFSWSVESISLELMKIYFILLCMFLIFVKYKIELLVISIFYGLNIRSDKQCCAD